MMGEQITHIEGLKELPPPISSTLAIAINGSRKSKHIVHWALEKFVPEGTSSFKLIYVRPKIIGVPTPMGNFARISQAREDVAADFRKEWIGKQVQVEIVQIESDDVVSAISEEVAKFSINKLVIGASSRNLFSRRRNLSSRISKCTPSFCTVYTVSKGKLLFVHLSDSETNGSLTDDCSDISSANNSSSRNSSSQEVSYASSKLRSSSLESRHSSLAMRSTSPLLLPLRRS